MRHLIAWLADVLIGPLCPFPGCGYRARGERSWDKHVAAHHAGREPCC